MSVIDPSLGTVFCEGRSGGVDVLMLAALLPLGQVSIRPVGGKHGMRAFIEGYLDNYRERQPPYLAFRDRDFDVEPPASVHLIRLQEQKPIWLSHRAAIENYFIDADLISQYWTEQEKSSSWSYGPAPSTSTIEHHIVESARELVGYQAVRWALARLKPAPRWPEIRTTWTKHGSGNLPSSLAYDHCFDQACKLIIAFREQIQGIRLDCFQEYAQEYRDRFGKTSFLENRRFLIWFHGKDHIVRLCHRLAPNFPRRHYTSWAAEHIDIGAHSDLQELVVRARKLA